MPTTIATENPAKDVRRYLKHWGSSAFVEDALHTGHTGLTRERRLRQSRTIALLVLQGLEYLEASESASLLARPLPLFYAAENISKACCIFNDPGLDAIDFRRHGLVGDKAKRYSIKNLECRVGRAPLDVWSRVFRLLNTDTIRLPLIEKGAAIARDHRYTYATKPLPRGARLRLGTLLRHLPELTHDVAVAEWGNPYVVHVRDSRIESETAGRNAVTLLLRHGHHQATRAMILNRETDLLRQFTRMRDELDVLQYQCSVPETEQINIPNMRCDIFGELYMDFARGTTVLSEIVTYFAALFILSDVVRYQVDQWNRLLEQHPEEAILVERFLDLVLRKFPNLALNELHRTTIIFRIGG